MNYSFREEGAGVGPCLIGPTRTQNTTCDVIHSYLNEGVRYSCDNLRYRLRSNPKDFDDLCMWLDTYMTSGKLVFYHGSNKIGGYREMWQWVHLSEADDRLPHEETSIVIGLAHVEGNGKANAGLGYLEFNPHKVMREGARLVRYLKGKGVELELVRYDLAIDFPVERDLLRLRKDGRKYACEISNSMTEYLGQRSKPGRCKLYDKAAERGYKGNLTRVELTCDAEWSADNVMQMLPVVYDYCQSQKGVLKGVTLAFMVALKEIARNGEAIEPWLRLVNPKTRAKLREAFAGNSQLVYDLNSVTSLIDSIKAFA